MQIEYIEGFDNHEMVVICNDNLTGLKGFIAIHNTNLGYALGATRYCVYESQESALSDSLKLSRLMTYKCALAGLYHGGGKGVIIAESSCQKSVNLLKAYAKRINLLNGTFITGEDVGMNSHDVQVLATETNFVIGKTKERKDSAYWTAVGVYHSIKVALKSIYECSAIEGRKFAVKGLGKVGYQLCSLLYRDGGRLTVCDTNAEAVKSLSELFPNIKVVSPDEIHKQKVDVYSPCALAEGFNQHRIDELNCRIICGGANNQLSSRLDGELLRQREILYIPDYLANAGGLISVAAELDKEGYNHEKVKKKVNAIQEKVKKIIRLSKENNLPTSDVADDLAEKIFLKKPMIKI